VLDLPDEDQLAIGQDHRMGRRNRVAVGPAERDMTIDGYRRSSQALQKATWGSAVGLVLAAFATLVFMLLNRSDEPLAKLLCVVKYLAAGVLALSMKWVERRIGYPVIPSQNKPPADRNGD